MQRRFIADPLPGQFPLHKKTLPVPCWCEF